MSITYEPGRYWCRITDQAITEASTGTKQFALRFVPIGKINPSDPEGELLGIPAEYERTAYLPITANTVDWVIDTLMALGFTGSNFSDLNPDNPNHHSFVGNQAAFSCEHSTYEGKTSEKWRPATGGDGSLKPIDAKGYKELDNLFGRTLKKKVNAAKKAEPKQDKPAEKTVPSEEDDPVPF